MTLQALIGSTITINVKMASVIAEGHSVTIKAPSNAGGEVLTAMPLSFTPANWNTNQGVSYKAKSVGSHTLKSIATSPYYRDGKPTYKETKNDIVVQVVPFIGWELINTYHSLQITGCAKLQIGTDSLSGLGASFTVGKAGGGNTAGGLTFMLKKPDGTNIACDTDLSGPKTFTANQTGTWYLYFAARAGSGAFTAAQTPQNIDLTNPGGYATVSFSTNAIYYDSIAEQSPTWTQPTSTVAQPLFNSYSSTGFFVELNTSFCSSVGGCSGGFTSIQPTAIAANSWSIKLTGGAGLASGCRWLGYWGYYVTDIAAKAGLMPEYSSGTTEWHYTVGKTFIMFC